MANILPLPYRPQQVDRYCLPACLQMVLAGLGISRTQDDLAAVLLARPNIGGASSNVLRLNMPGLNVAYRAGDLGDLAHWIDQGDPVIAFVEAGELPVWRGEDFRHAVVVVGLDEQAVYLLDPAAGNRVLAVPHGDFSLAWEAMDTMYATITRQT